jgi:hypothetical protein
MLDEDSILEIFKNLSLEDIKKTCNANKQMMNLCKKYKHIIFKDIVYVLEYFKFEVGNPEETIELNTDVFKNKENALKKMNSLYNKKLTELKNKVERDDSFEFSFEDSIYNSKTITEENAKDTDYIYKWKIKTKKML